MQFLKTYFTDIRFWLIFFFLIRLYGITNPPLDAAHNWRQTTVTMVARNYLEIDDRFLYPRIDVGGEKTRITGMEFPILNDLIFLISKIFGYQHWYGRIINLVISTIGVWYFFRIIKTYFSDNHAFCSSLLLLGSIWFAYSRKIMPDTFAVSLVFAGMYYGLLYLTKRHNLFYLVLYFIFTTLGILSKLPMGYLLMVFTLPILSNSISLKIKTIFISVNAISITIVGWYYFSWVPFLTNFYGLKHFFMGKSMSLGL
jgi:4-amino-4-deoxy-L-arabinose transferase-like glycosyltransferase